MAHIQTRQLKPDQDGAPRKAYQVRWIDTAHKERARQFSRMGDARAFKAEIERELIDDRLERSRAFRAAERERTRKVYETRLSRHVVDLSQPGFPVRGFFVYFLWGCEDADRPLYVGKSTNVLARLGIHLADPSKRVEVERVSILRFETKAQMDIEEVRLIRLHCPAWNIASMPPSGSITA